MLLITFTCLFINLNLHSQTPQPIFTHYSVTNGLPSSEVHHAMQDAKGYMWFATNIGVSRFDGYKFQNYSFAEGLPDNTIFNIYEDYQGRIWFISFSGRLSYYKEGVIKTYKYNESIQNEVVNLFKGSFYVDKLDQLYVQTGAYGYVIIEPDGKITRQGLDSSYTAAIIYIDSTLFKYGGLQASWTRDFDILLTKDTLHIKVDNIDKRANFQCIVLQNKDILFTYGRSVISIAPNLSVMSYLIGHDALSSLEDLDNNIWIGTYQGGVQYYKNGLQDATPATYLAGLSITSITQDNEGGLWFTTLERGVFCLSSIEYLTYNREFGLDNDKVICLATDSKNKLYAGLGSGTLLYINDSVYSKSQFIANSVPSISALYYDVETSKLWVGSSSKDVLIDAEGVHFVSGNGGSHEIIKAADGGIWLGSHNRLKKVVDQETVYTSEYHQAPFRITALHEDKQGTLWVGNLHGLWKFEDSTFVSVHDSDSLLRYLITDIDEINGDLCVSTGGAGLLIIKGDSIIQIGFEAGLTSDNINDVFIEGNDIWLATNRGVNQVSFKSDDYSHYEINSYSSSDGLASNEINQVIKFKDKIWAATNMGLTFFNPDASVSTYETKIYIELVSIMNRDTSLLPSYDLAYDQNQLTIYYKGLSFRNVGRLDYRYRVMDIDTGWVYTNQTS
ncbi:MAG: hypothetical protein JKX73_10815, partial [Flavobacteriales bacterium]|nr:hypothetical protein [Flavobacteriales bacterium]